MRSLLSNRKVSIYKSYYMIHKYDHCDGSGTESMKNGSFWYIRVRVDDAQFRTWHIEVVPIWWNLTATKQIEEESVNTLNGLDTEFFNSIVELEWKLSARMVYLFKSHEFSFAIYLDLINGHKLVQNRPIFLINLWRIE